MLVIYVVAAVIAFFIYLVIRITIQDWIDELNMSRLKLKRNHNINVESRMIDTPSRTDPIEISDDDSENSPSNSKGKQSAFPFKTDYKSRDIENSNTEHLRVAFDKSTDSMESGEEDTGPVFAASTSKKQQPLFNWMEPFKNDTRNTKTVNKKKSMKSAVDTVDVLNDPYNKRTKFTRNDRSPAMNWNDKDFSIKEMKEDGPPKVVIQHHRLIAGVSVSLPVKPYPCQIAVMNMTIQGCSKSQNALLESPTGSGKTLALLCAVLAWQEHHNARVMQESSKMAKTDGIPLSGNFLSSIGNKYCESGAGNSASCSDKLAANDDCCGGDGQSDFDDLWKENAGKREKLPKIYYGTRTHKQIEQVIRELKKTVYKSKKMTILSSREFTCIQNSDRNKTDLCNDLLDPKKRLKCEYYTENNKKILNTFVALASHGLGEAWDIEDLVAVGRMEKCCPYFAARSLMAEADIIFCPYNYLIDPHIRETMQIDLKGQIIVLDEAHNIEDICRDAASASFREDHLTDVANECETLGKQREADRSTFSTIATYLFALVKLMKHVSVDKISATARDDLSSPFWSGDELMELFDMHGLGKSRYRDFVSAATAAIMDLQAAKDQFRETEKEVRRPTISAGTQRVIELLKFSISTTFKFMSDYRACIIESTAKDVRSGEDNTWYSKQKNEQRVRTLKLLCMNPAVIFSPLAESARSIILASGTLTPTTSFQSELDTKFPHMLCANHVIPKDQVYVTCIPKGPNGVALKANYQNVNSWRFQDELGTLVVDVCESVPHGVLCFFSSYHVMHTQIERWKHNSTWNKIQSLKHVFVEPRYGGDLAQIMKDYREAIDYTSDVSESKVNGALFFAVFRGKVAEGIDFSDNEARCVLTIGIPYPVRKDPVIDMKYQYNETNAIKGLLRGGEWYTVQAFRALNQALGRCVRHRNDWGAVLLVDERFLQLETIQYLPKWIKAMWTEQGSRYKLKEELRNFVESQRKRESQLFNQESVDVD